MQIDCTLTQCLSAIIDLLLLGWTFETEESGNVLNFNRFVEIALIDSIP